MGEGEVAMGEGEVEIPSPVPVEGWARGIDGNWWPPAPPRHRPAPTAHAAQLPTHHRRRIGGAIALILLAAAILAIVAGIAAILAWYDDKPATSTVSQASHIVVWLVASRT